MNFHCKTIDDCYICEIFVSINFMSSSIVVSHSITPFSRAQNNLSQTKTKRNLPKNKKPSVNVVFYKLSRIPPINNKTHFYVLLCPGVTNSHKKQSDSPFYWPCVSPKRFTDWFFFSFFTVCNVYTQFLRDLKHTQNTSYNINTS